MKDRAAVLRLSVMVATAVVMLAWSMPHIPRVYVDFSRVPILRGIEQPETYGTDTIADMYAAKVVLNDPADMYARQRLEQTPLEAATWSKEASSPYPPLMLLSLAFLYVLGDVTGLELYGMVLVLAVSFIALSAWYFWRTRWYLFPILYLNFAYFAERFVEVQDGSYLIMLNVVVVALLLAERRRDVPHVLMAIATVLKLLPLYHLAHMPEMRPRTRAVVAGVLAAGFVLPYFIWDNYLYIYSFNAGNKGGLTSALGGLAVALPMAWLIWRRERGNDFDADERVGWALVPFAVFLAVKTNAARPLLIALLVPDKRGVRNVAAAVGLLLFEMFPSWIRLGSVTYIATAVLLVWLISGSSRRARS